MNRQSINSWVLRIGALSIIALSSAFADELHVFDPKGFLRYSGEFESGEVLLVEVADVTGAPLHQVDIQMLKQDSSSSIASRSYRGQVLFSDVGPGNWQISGAGNALQVKNVTLTASLLPQSAGTTGSGAATQAGGTGGATGGGISGGAAGGGLGGGAAAGAGAGAAVGGGAVAGGTILGVGTTTAVIGGGALVAGGTYAAIESNNNNNGVSPFE
ncbi:MAG: hypothetical protein KDD70_03025 [Bdellovibrionales bacterium]|nr:hypothetical protein [Bdellovibrionales bacterium]